MTKIVGGKDYFGKKAPSLKKMMGCHGNHSITYSLPEFRLGYINFLDSVDLGGHFGNHEKKSRGGGAW